MLEVAPECLANTEVLHLLVRQLIKFCNGERKTYKICYVQFYWLVLCFLERILWTAVALIQKNIFDLPGLSVVCLMREKIFHLQSKTRTSYFLLRVDVLLHRHDLTVKVHCSGHECFQFDLVPLACSLQECCSPLSVSLYCEAEKTI